MVGFVALDDEAELLVDGLLALELLELVLVELTLVAALVLQLRLGALDLLDFLLQPSVMFE